MCPPHSSQPRAPSHVDTRPPHYTAWIASARCFISQIYQHRIDKDHIICAACYIRAPWENRSNYILKRRHALHLGSPPCYDSCILCSTQITTFRHLNQCVECDVILGDFLRYLNRTREDPYNSDRPTLICISQTVVGPSE